tara:strand:+ start:146 stop:457 length:312 start_codon:yes stop_codon:yes gene_type:complete
MRRLLSLFLFIFSVSLFSEVVIDVRTPDEFDVGHVQGSQNIEWENIQQIQDSIKKDEKIYLYCRSGNRSGKATKILIDLGYKNVTNLGSLQSAADFLELKIVN